MQLPAKSAGPRPTLLEVDKYAIPVTIEEAYASPYAEFWHEAILAELRSLHQNGTWKLVERQPGMKVIPCKWVFDIKTDAAGKPIRFKARLVAGGHRQVAGVDYEETYAPVSRHTTLRTFLAVCAARGWNCHQLDVKTAFLHGPIDTDVYMLQPPGFVDGTDMVCHLHKCLYGLKQAPRAWYETLKACLQRLGFEPTAADRSFWVRAADGPLAVVYLTSVVDDIAVASPDEQQTQAVVRSILAAFPGSYMGRIQHYTGMKVTWLPEEHAVLLTQPAHVQEALDAFEPFMACSAPCKLPIKNGLKLHAHGTSECADSEPLDVRQYPYRSLVGMLNYIACCTRPDIAYTVNQLSKYCNAPTVAHWDTALLCLRYLKGTQHWGIKLGHKPGVSHRHSDGVHRHHAAWAYADSNHGGDGSGTRPVAGAVLQVLGGSVWWVSRNQQLTSTSSTESEYRGLSDVAKEALWLAKLLPHFDLPDFPFLIYGDNQGSLDAVNNYTHTKHTKHIEIHLEFMRERVQLGQLVFGKVDGKVNPADIFTKALARPLFEQHRANLAMCEELQP